MRTIPGRSHAGRSLRTLGLVAVWFLSPSAIAGDPLEHSPSGKSLVIPEAEKSKGTLYYALPGKERLIRFVSDAPFEKINGVSNTVIGYAIAGPKDQPAQLRGGEWHLPVASLRTQNPTRDEHLRSADWLDAAKFPNIVFRLTGVTDVKEQSTSDLKLKSFTATLAGEMTIHGVTKPISVPNATIRFRETSTAFRDAIGEGDLLLISAKIEVALADYNVKNKIITVEKKVAEKIQVECTLFMSTVPPESQAPTPGTAPGTAPAPGSAPPASNPK